MVIEKLNLTEEWDKTFPKSEKVSRRKVTFVNRYGVTLAADMYVPANVPAGVRLPAIAVSGPFGAVKEQASGLYAQQLAERGFLTIAFDPSFTGESGGMPRRVASPDINTEDFCAAVDFLSNEPNVDPEAIGILGICGFGGFAISAAANDPRIHATVASTMYDIDRCTANGYFDANDNAESRDRAHSFYMGKTAYAKLQGDNKEPLVMHGANHTDLYDRLDKIPFDRLAEFFHKNLK